MDRYRSTIRLNTVEQQVMQRRPNLDAADAPEAYEQLCADIECATRVQEVLATHDIYDMPEAEFRARTADVQYRLCVMDRVRRQLGHLAAPEIAAAHTSTTVENLAIDGIDLSFTRQP
jgi:hypothetical protein